MANPLDEKRLLAARKPSRPANIEIANLFRNYWGGLLIKNGEVPFEDFCPVVKGLSSGAPFGLAPLIPL